MKTALVLSGGGARGAFEVGAEAYLREAMGYRWDVIAGVSVGALNAAMIAQGKHDELYRCWKDLCNEDVYTGEFSMWTLLRIAGGKDSIYSNKPLWKMIEKNIDPDQIQIKCLVGAVDLVSGSYQAFSPPSPLFRHEVLASTTIPVVWKPVTMHDGFWVDGGVRNISPIADVLSEEPDEVIIISCAARKSMAPSGPLNNAVEIGLRALDIATNEIFCNDVETFLRTNRLVQEAAKSGVTLHHSDGRPYKCYLNLVVEPTKDLGNSLEFSPELNRMRFEHGWQRAKEVCDEVAS